MLRIAVGAELALRNRADLVGLVDPEDLPGLLRWTWIELGGYIVRQQRTASGSTLIYLHRQLMQARPFEVVDHINNNRLDNRRSCNLRLCTQSENLANRPSPRPTMYRGVYYERRGGRWRAQIKAAGKNRYLGTYQTAELAALAYDREARKVFGRFARLNFPDLVEEEQLHLPGFDPDPFDIPAPHALHGPPDAYEWAYIAAQRRARLGAAPAPIYSDDSCDIPF